MELIIETTSHKIIQDEQDMRDTTENVRIKLISDELQRISTHGHTRVGRSTRTYMYQPCADTGCSLEDFPGAMDNRDGWERDREREREREIQGTLCYQHDLMISSSLLRRVVRFPISLMFIVLIWCHVNLLRVILCHGRERERVSEWKKENERENGDSWNYIVSNYL